MLRVGWWPLFAACSSALSADIDDPSVSPAIARVTASLVEAYHYSGETVNDEVAVAWLEEALDRLDYDRHLFLASDVDGFRAQTGTLDDGIHEREPDLALMHQVWDTYLQRSAASFAAAQTIAAEPMDFTADERVDADRQNDPWPANEAQQREFWRLRVKSEVLASFLDGGDEAAAREKVRKRYARLQGDLAELTEADLLQTWLGALCGVFDPHSTWMAPAANEDFGIDMSMSLEGIGATLRNIDGYTTVESLVKGGPADLSGVLHEKDRILSVAQGDAAPVDVVEMRIDRVVKLIRGPKGTVVRLTIVPAGADLSQTSEVTIRRDKVRLEEQRVSSAVREIVTPTGTRRIGILTVPGFYTGEGGEGTTFDARRAIAQMTSEGTLDGLIVDLRDNGGGSLNESVDLTGLFLKGGPVVQIRYRDGRIQSLADPGSVAEWSGPLVVAVSQASASASEIFAGAIQDYGRGLIVGSNETHGKGTVQTVIDMADMVQALSTESTSAEKAGALKLTTQKFYRVSGASTQVEGVKSDVVLPSDFDGMDVGEGVFDHALPWDTIAPARGWKRKPLAPASLAMIRAASETRIADNAEIQLLRDRAALREEVEARDTWSLQLAARKSDLDRQKALFPERPKLPESERGDERPDPVIDEVFAIAADWSVATSALQAAK